MWWVRVCVGGGGSGEQAVVCSTQSQCLDPGSADDSGRQHWFNLWTLFLFDDTATTAIYTLPLHDALPIPHTTHPHTHPHTHTLTSHMTHPHTHTHTHTHTIKNT